MTIRADAPTITVFSRRTGWSLFSTIAVAIAVRRQRLALRELDKSALADIGVSRSQADAESRRPVWDVPANWRR